MNVDVAIVGAGPAGSTLAALLAARGVRVALAERDVFPRDKLCGEFLSYDALPLAAALGVLREIDLRGAPRIERCRLVGSQRAYEFAFPEAARGVSRLLLDELLYAAALARGAVPLAGWTATQLEPALVLERDGEPLQIAARVVAGAWGRWGRFDSILGRTFVRDRSRRNFGFKRHYIASGAERDVIELYPFRRGYLGVNGIENGLTNICGLVHAARLEHHKGRWPAFVAEIRAERPQLEALYARHTPAQETFLSSEPVIFRGRDPVVRGVFMIGDASGIIDPLAGNGIAMAMQSALIAAGHILRVLERPGMRSAIENDYRRDHRAMFGGRIRWSRRVARLLSHPRLIDRAIKATTAPAIGRFLLRKTRGPREEIDHLTEAWFSC